MKLKLAFTLLSAVLFFFDCKASVPGENIRNMPSVNKSNLVKDVKFLTSLQPARNFYNLTSLNKAAEYIKKEFEKSGLQVNEQKFNVDGKEYKNLVCSVGPDSSPERIVIGAHYDVAGDQPGADDNASGVAGLLEIARLLHSEKPQLKQKIELVAFTLEEPPMFGGPQMGSAIHARALSGAGVKLRAMISLEMIGYFSEEKNSQDYPVAALQLLYPSVGNFIGVVGKMGQEKITGEIKDYMSRGSEIDVQSLNAPPFMPGTDLSDHRNYWDYGYNAVMITDTSFYRNHNYHEKTDTIETLNFVKMAEVVKGVYHALVNL
jgi:Zn-dependent M28 family amino/carboxypeptidase